MCVRVSSSCRPCRQGQHPMIDALLPVHASDRSQGDAGCRKALAGTSQPYLVSGLASPLERWRAQQALQAVCMYVWTLTCDPQAGLVSVSLCACFVGCLLAHVMCTAPPACTHPLTLFHSIMPCLVSCLRWHTQPPRIDTPIRHPCPMVSLYLRGPPPHACSMSTGFF